MKSALLKKLIIYTLVIITINACQEQKSETRLYSTASYELSNNDTINLIDNNKLKQGHWIIKDFSSEPPTIIESGIYKDNLKQGVWNYYDSAGKINRSVKYINDIPTKTN